MITEGIYSPLSKSVLKKQKNKNTHTHTTQNNRKRYL